MKDDVTDEQILAEARLELAKNQLLMALKWEDADETAAALAAIRKARAAFADIIHKRMLSDLDTLCEGETVQ